MITLTVIALVLWFCRKVFATWKKRSAGEWAENVSFYRGMGTDADAELSSQEHSPGEEIINNPGLYFHPANIFYDEADK